MSLTSGFRWDDFESMSIDSGFDFDNDFEKSSVDSDCNNVARNMSYETEFDNTPRPLFIELAELTTKNGGPLGTEWTEIARWVKYEEDTEEGGQRWSKPYVPTVHLTAVKALCNVLENAEIRLNFNYDSVERASRALVDLWSQSNLIERDDRGKVLDALLRPHVHLYETTWSISKTKMFQRKKKKGQSKTPEALAAAAHSRMSSSFRRSSIICSVVYNESTKDDSEKNVQFLRKLPPDAESANIMVGQLDCLKQPVGAFLRFEEPMVLGNFTEVPLPTRFVFILLTPIGMNHIEIGRAIGTLFTDPTFKETAYKATNKQKLMKGVEAFLDEVVLLPPATWDKAIRLEPPKQPAGEGHGSSSSDDEEGHGDDSSLRRTGRLFGGLIEDIKRKSSWYGSDFMDSLSLQCLATWLFLYFACLTPMIAFGALMGKATNNSMGTMETMVSGCVCGIMFALFSGQPLTILGSTGPMLVFEKILVHFAESNELNYLEFRLWVGIWIAFILLILVATDASTLVSYITRFTEDNFATLIAVIFMVEAVKNVLFSKTSSAPVVKTRDIQNRTFDFGDDFDFLETGDQNGHAELQEEQQKAVFFMSLLLFIGTFLCSYMLREFRVSPFFPTWIRYLVSDFAVVLAIGSMTLVDFFGGVNTGKLDVPTKFAPTSDERGWFIPPMQRNPVWSIFIAGVPALLATILIFMDQQITAVIVNRKDHKLKKGCGYHLDLFVLSILIVVCSCFGLPWFVAATVESLTNVGSLKMESESAAPGEVPTFLGVREQRVTNLLVFTTVGLSVLLTPVLKFVPMPVLYGVFLFMGFSALMRMDLFQRILLVLMPLKYQPDKQYLRQVPLRRVHMYTVIQVVCLALLWIIKSLQSTAILFPLMLVVMMVVRKLLDRVFTQKELSVLDDLLPGSTNGKSADGTSDDAEDQV